MSFQMKGLFDLWFLLSTYCTHTKKTTQISTYLSVFMADSSRIEESSEKTKG